jgi:ABC-type antimicrobial peptide transport system permease subunit
MEDNLKNTEIELSPIFLLGLFILAIITFFFIYFSQNSNLESAKIDKGIQDIKDWLTNKMDLFFTFLHVEGEMIKKVI